MYLARLEDNTLGIGAAGHNKHILGVLNGSNSPGSQDQLLPGLLQVDDVDAVGLLFEDVLLHRGLAVIRANVGGCSQHLGDVILGYSKGSKSSRHCEQSFLNCSYEARCSQCHMECGKKEASRAECIKQLWAYLKKNNLQDPENKQFFIPDKKMAKIFGNDKIRAFGMAKFLSAHLS